MTDVTLLLVNVFALALSVLFLFEVVAILRGKRDDRGALLHPFGLIRHAANPLLTPGDYAWEAGGTFNPAAIAYGGLVHLFYRALGSDGVSRIGYAQSDGKRITHRSPYPVFGLEGSATYRDHRMHTHPGLVASGGSWAGTEDPRAVILDDKVYLSFSAFSGWDSIRLGVVSLPLQELPEKRWKWSRPVFLSSPNEVRKNWVFFPKRINGKVAVLHSLYGRTPGTVEVDYVDSLDREPDQLIHSPYTRVADDSRWDYIVRGAGAPPLETEYGWLVFYHALTKDEGHRYKVGALLLDRDDPSKIIGRSRQPILAPDEWYENEGAKPGVVYVCGAVREGDTIQLYYGGADSNVCAAHLSLGKLARELVS